MAPLPFQPVSPANLIIIIIVMTISVSGEETGWRGFALPRMQSGRTALKASLVLGSLHTLWHLPFWIVLGELERFGWIYWILNWAFILALTIYMTWIMNNTRNSLLLAVLLHWTFNIASAGFLPLTTVVPAYAIFIVLAWAVSLGLLGLYGSKQLVKQEAG
jgi:membrane protease YdiL (CAAX protease family)